MEPQGQPNEQPEGDNRAEATPREVRRTPQPGLKCPFCSGKRFDFGRDVYAGPDQLMYCRRTPRRGQSPEEGLSLPMKGAVCLDCGYVAMMVDINQLHAPIRRPRDAASALARQAGAAAHLARSQADEAAEALRKMEKADAVEALERMKTSGAGDVRPPASFAPAAAPEAPAGQDAPAADDGFGDLDTLLDEAEKSRQGKPKGRDLGSRSIFE